MWDRYQRTTKEIFGRNIKSTGCIYIPGSKYREAEGHLKLMYCLQDSVINSGSRIGKYINKLEFYK